MPAAKTSSANAMTKYLLKEERVLLSAMAIRHKINNDSIISPSPNVTAKNGVVLISRRASVVRAETRKPTRAPRT